MTELNDSSASQAQKQAATSATRNKRIGKTPEVTPVKQLLEQIYDAGTTLLSLNGRFSLPLKNIASACILYIGLQFITP
jgi:hypothetical protein